MVILPVDKSIVYALATVCFPRQTLVDGRGHLRNLDMTNPGPRPRPIRRSIAQILHNNTGDSEEDDTEDDSLPRSASGSDSNESSSSHVETNATSVNSTDFKTWLMKQLRLSAVKGYATPGDEPVKSEPLTLAEPIQN